MQPKKMRAIYTFQMFLKFRTQSLQSRSKIDYRNIQFTNI